VPASHFRWTRPDLEALPSANLAGSEGGPVESLLAHADSPDRTRRQAMHSREPQPAITIGFQRGLGLADWRELWRYRDLFIFLVRRDIKGRYAQSILGVGWAIAQPVFTMVVFTIVFGGMAGVSSDGVPYAVFSLAALVPWTYFSSSVSAAGTSLVGASALLTKVYFPRLVIPVAPVLSKLVDLAIGLVILVAFMVWFRIAPTSGALLLPVLILLMMLAATGLGVWFTALAVQYRDVTHLMGMGLQLFMYASPVIYSITSIPERYRLWYALNPMAGILAAFRAVLLGNGPIPWDMLMVGTAVTLVILTTGLLFFRKMEGTFADVV
jgi:lipopolysaccharide transport system permease protein